MAITAALDGSRTLLISTDPAPSLGDALQRRLHGEPTRIPLRRAHLDAVEIRAAEALERWIQVRRGALEQIALRGTWLDREDIARLLRLSLPGIDELAALFEIVRFGAPGRYDLIVVDTAPTGHTLRMIAMPDTLRAVARVFDAMQSKHRVMVEALRGSWTPDAEDAVIDEIDRAGRELHALLRDPARVRMSLVTLPEPMAVEETADAAAALRAADIPLAGVIVNRITPRRERACGWCDRRRQMDQHAVAAIRRRLRTVALVEVAARNPEPIGTRALAGIGRDIQATRVQVSARPRRVEGRWRAPLGRDSRADLLSLLSPADTRLVLFGGKGGVGKTTCAAAAAIAIARHAPHRRVLIVSTDPAHSLADAFGSPLSDAATRVRNAPPNLLAREMDASAGFRAVRARYADAIDDLFDRPSRGGGVGLDAGHDRRVMQGLIDLAPPGIDELAGVIEVIETIESQTDDLVIMDTAPSGHALRLLEMPALVQDWTKALMSILLKYQPVVRLGGLGATLVKLSQGLGRLRALLGDPRRAAFVVVTRAAALPRAETMRLLASLAGLRVHVPVVIVNAVGRGTCRACRDEARAEEHEIAALRRELGNRRPAILAPAELPPPRSPGRLRGWYGQWRL